MKSIFGKVNSASSSNQKPLEIAHYDFLIFSPNLKHYWLSESEILSRTQSTNEQAHIIYLDNRDVVNFVLLQTGMVKSNLKQQWYYKVHNSV